MTMISYLRRSIIPVALFCGVFRCAVAQESFSVPTRATSDEVYRWIVSGDPRMVAWGAYFATVNHDATVLPYLRRLAEEWVSLRTGYNPDGSSLVRSDEEKDRLREMASVLDALIQMHGTVEPDAIERLATDFRGQALTLFATMPETERRALAESIYGSRIKGAEYVRERRPSDPLFPPKIMSKLAGFSDLIQQYATGDLIHLAAAILANDPPPGFAASLMDETTVELELSIGGPDPRAGNGMGPACGDSLYMAPPKDWPKEWTYVMEQHWPTEELADMEVIVPGMLALTTRRGEVASSCSTIEPLSSLVRMWLLAQMAGVTMHNLGWDVREYEEVPYSSDFSYQKAVKSAVAKREQAFEATAAVLAAKGFMTPLEATGARPTLNIVVRDARETKEPELPGVPLVGIKIGTITSATP
jgi:hypothetical protein